MSRLKGQEVTIGFTTPTGDQEGLEDVVDFEVELDIEILEEGYLGQTAKQYDSIYHGVSGKASFHMAADDYFDLAEKVQNRAERRTPAGGKFTATATLAFPSGRRVRVTFEDIHFGAFPMRFSGRSDYVQASVNWKGERIRRVS